MILSSAAREEDWKYPLPAQPNEEGYLDVGATHRIYWHEYGNRLGEPVLFIHGGPGGASSPIVARFFDPERYRILLFDQRGCGKSTPNAADDAQAALMHNTTADLARDIERLRTHLAVEGKMHVFGGSWGSTLALAYATLHADHVETLILRGIYLCRRVDIDYFYQGNAARYHIDPYDASLPGAYIFFPEAWKEFVGVIPVAKRSDMVAAYARLFAATPKNEEERMLQERAALAWSVWEGSTSFLALDPIDLDHFNDPAFAMAFARIENHYFMNGAFLGGHGAKARGNNYLLEQVKKIAHLPIHVVQGRYDQVCPRFGADALVAALEGHKAEVNYVITTAGHAAPERETMRALVHIMDNLPPMTR